MSGLLKSIRSTLGLIPPHLHRSQVGGLWDEVGRLQFDFMLAQGLQPGSKLLDIGCGCLRGGIFFVEYLKQGNYFGIDKSQELIDSGYRVELKKAGLQAKLPRKNLRCNDDFQFAVLSAGFDYAIAQSVFTHLTLNDIRVCMARLAPVMRVGGTLFATFFLVRGEEDWGESKTFENSAITTYPNRDPYHYTDSDVAYCVAGMPWRYEIIGGWGHPRAQQMVAFTKIGGLEQL